MQGVRGAGHQARRLQELLPMITMMRHTRHAHTKDGSVGAERRVCDHVKLYREIVQH